MGVCICSFTDKVVRKKQPNNFYHTKKSVFQIGIRNIADINVPSAFNIIYSNQNELQNIQNKKNSSKRNSFSLNRSFNNNESKSRSQSINISAENDEENLLFKKSSSYKLGEGVTSFKINNFNDNPIDGFKKSKTYREENIYATNLPNQGYLQNRFATILETINEVSSKVDSSELSDEDENKNKNKNDNNNDNNNL